MSLVTWPLTSQILYIDIYSALLHVSAVYFSHHQVIIPGYKNSKRVRLLSFYWFMHQHRASSPVTTPSELSPTKNIGFFIDGIKRRYWVWVRSRYKFAAVLKNSVIYGNTLVSVRTLHTLATAHYAVYRAFERFRKISRILPSNTCTIPHTCHSVILNHNYYRFWMDDT